MQASLRIINIEQNYLKWTLKLSLVTQKILDNDLVVICKIKTKLSLDKPAYMAMCILELSKVPMCEFHVIISNRNTVTNGDYDSQILTV